VEAPKGKHLSPPTTHTTQSVFGQERSLFPHPKTRNINHGTSKEINLSATKTRPKTNRVEKGKTKARNNKIIHASASLDSKLNSK